MIAIHVPVSHLLGTHRNPPKFVGLCDTSPRTASMAKAATVASITVSSRAAAPAAAVSSSRTLRRTCFRDA